MLNGAPETFARDSQIAALTQVINSLKQNTSATIDNTSAITKALPGSLSSLYSAGQVAGFGFADGGIMTDYGPLSLKKYDGGGIASSPQVAMFGEGSGPEAFIPLKGGAVPVSFASAIPITVNVANNNSPQPQQQPILINAPITIVDQGSGVTTAAAQAATNFQSMLAGYARR